jgi:hypothetical protein
VTPSCWRTERSGKSKGFFPLGINFGEPRRYGSVGEIEKNKLKTKRSRVPYIAIFLSVQFHYYVNTLAKMAK